MSKPSGSPRDGFTILELMIATMVFSVVLLLATAGIMQIARIYYKGVTETNTQNAARNIIDSISQAIQFSGGDISGTATSPSAGTNYAFCIGNQQFSYRLGWQVENVAENPTTNQIRHALVRKSAADCTPQDLSSASVTGRELVGQHMRLSNLVVEPTADQPNQYHILVRVVYGDNDLLNNPTDTDASCKAERSGTQFCATSELSTIVVKRVE
jgi:prepilin-type N-terminal cleavage/methylation domain-containing protein